MLSPKEAADPKAVVIEEASMLLDRARRVCALATEARESCERYLTELAANKRPVLDIGLSADTMSLCEQAVLLARAEGKLHLALELFELAQRR